jgi:hypothetical protein
VERTIERRQNVLTWTAIAVILPGHPTMGEVAAVATVLLVGKALCVDCLAAKGGMTTERVKDSLPKMTQTIRVFQAEDCCSRCLERKTVYIVPAPD